ncbi:EAL domain-containing protein [Domibacillus tundrae]|uniref:EAL domain-containing protein n=1 Tax=Domibacillus tundrae TaxID=1587527 RepID=UPI003394CC7D
MLGRIHSAGGIQSLGPFFNDPSADPALQRQVDRHVRDLALKKFAEEQTDGHLFINVNPDWLCMDWREGDKDWVSQHGIDPERIVLEVTEFLFSMKEKEMLSMLNYYKNLGCKIAIDDVGKGFSNLDRIASFQPDIIKVDIHLLKNSTQSQSFMDVLYSLSVLARRMGASLLFEGMETEDEWQNAWKNGGRFYQGYLFAYPAPHFQQIGAPVQAKLSRLIDQLVEGELAAWDRQFELEQLLNKKMIHILEAFPYLADPAAYLTELTMDVKEYCYRVYICDDKGNQKTANYMMTDGSWKKQVEYNGKNWSWRPYFLHNIAKMKVDKKGILSEAYRDLETDVRIRTFSYPIQSGYLFLDLTID